VKLRKRDGKGIDAEGYVKYVARPILWPLCKQLDEDSEDPDVILMVDRQRAWTGLLVD